MSNGGGFLEVIRVLQTVGPLGRESGRAGRIYPLFQWFEPQNYTFLIYLCPNVYICFQMCIFSPKCVSL